MIEGVIRREYMSTEASEQKLDTYCSFCFENQITFQKKNICLIKNKGLLNSLD